MEKEIMIKAVFGLMVVMGILFIWLVQRHVKKMRADDMRFSEALRQMPKKCSCIRCQARS